MERNDSYPAMPGDTDPIQRSLAEGTGALGETVDAESADVKGAAQELRRETKEAARQMARTAREQAGRVGSVVKQQSTTLASQATTTLRDQADTAKVGLAHTLDQAAVRLRERTAEMNRGELGMRMAQPLERSADYLRRTPLESMPEDLSHTIEANPLPSVAVAFVAGWMLGALFKRR
jgi:ElaB/YqjD/DUF883 family membrane-anchored ribosome-binding protein